MLSEGGGGLTIQIGVTGWGDHDKLYPDAKARQQKLKTYATHFDVVEVDSSFYALYTSFLKKNEICKKDIFKTLVALRLKGFLLLSQFSIECD